MDIFEKRLKELRKEKGDTQEKLAKKLNTTDDSIFSWEKGRSQPDIKMIRKICLYFEVSADYLLGLEDEAGIKTYCKNYVNQINNSGNGNVNFN